MYSADGATVRVMTSATGTCGAIGAPAGGAAALPSSLASRAAIAIPPTAAMTPATTMILIFLRMEVTLSWMQDSGPSEALCRHLCGG